MNRTIDLATSFAASAARLGAGLSVGRLGRRPERMLEIFEFEACPFCRKVRDALSMLDLEAVVYPCPKGGQRFRPVLAKRGGKLQFPWLDDPNTGRSMYESEEIVRYLFATYGDGNMPWQLSIGPLSTATAALASAWRPGAGGFARPSREPREELELWSFEASPYCRLVREALCSGRMQVPWLHDPNTGVSMFESADIVAYLDRTYAIDGRVRSASAASAGPAS